MEAWFLIVSRVLRLSAECYHKAACRWGRRKESARSSAFRPFLSFLRYQGLLPLRRERTKRQQTLMQPLGAHQRRKIRRSGAVDDSPLGDDGIAQDGRRHIEHRIEYFDIRRDVATMDFQLLTR